MMCKMGPYLGREGLLARKGTYGAYLLNSFHEKGHAPQCGKLFGPTFVRMLGALDGENAERYFARMALVAHPTRVMHPARRNGALAFDRSRYSESRSFDHAAYLQQMCVLAERRKHHAGVAYAAALATAERSRGVAPSVLHARVPASIRGLLARSRVTEDASKGKVPSTLSPEEQLLVQQGKLHVECFVLEERLYVLGQRDRAFFGSAELRVALADYERGTAPTAPPSIGGMKARLGVVRAELVRVQRDMKERGMVSGTAAATVAATVAYNTMSFNKSIAAVLDLLQSLNMGYLVRCVGGWRGLPAPSCRPSRLFPAPSSSPSASTAPRTQPSGGRSWLGTRRPSASSRPRTSTRACCSVSPRAPRALCRCPPSTLLLFSPPSPSRSSRHRCAAARP